MLKQALKKNASYLDDLQSQDTSMSERIDAETERRNRALSSLDIEEEMEVEAPKKAPLVEKAKEKAPEKAKEKPKEKAMAAPKASSLKATMDGAKKKRVPPKRKSKGETKPRKKVSEMNAEELIEFRRKNRERRKKNQEEMQITRERIGLVGTDRKTIKEHTAKIMKRKGTLAEGGIQLSAIRYFVKKFNVTRVTKDVRVVLGESVETSTDLLIRTLADISKQSEWKTLTPERLKFTVREIAGGRFSATS